MQWREMAAAINSTKRFIHEVNISKEEESTTDDGTNTYNITASPMKTTTREDTVMTGTGPQLQSLLLGEDLATTASKMRSINGTTTKSAKSKSLTSAPPMLPPTTSVSFTINNLMNQSTIYRRHEARLARTYALRDDPRPAFLRVMSGLPIFRSIVPPYDPDKLGEAATTTTVTTKATATVSSSPNSPLQQQLRRLGDYSEETFYSSSDIPSQLRQDDATHTDKTNRLATGVSTPIQSSLQAMIATGGSSVAVQYLLTYAGLGSAARGHASASASTTRFTPFVSAHDISLQKHYHQPHLQHQHYHPQQQLVRIYAQQTRSAVISAASSISILFGTKAFLDQYMLTSNMDMSLSEYDHRYFQSGSNTTLVQPTSILSSALAGTVAGVFQQLQILPTTIKTHTQNLLLGILSSSTQQQQQKNSRASTTILARNNILGRHALASILYFSIYESLSNPSQWISSSSSSTSTKDGSTTTSAINDNNKSKSTTSILMAGMVAGCVHTGMLSSSTAAATTATTSYVSSVATRPRAIHFCGGLTMWKAMLRAAPVHATVFMGYEAVKDGIVAT